MQQITRLIERSDLYLDLHTNHYGDTPFVFIDREDVHEEVAWAKALGSDHMITGRNACYPDDESS